MTRKEIEIIQTILDDVFTLNGNEIVQGPNNNYYFDLIVGNFKEIKDGKYAGSGYVTDQSENPIWNW